MRPAADLMQRGGSTATGSTSRRPWHLRRQASVILAMTVVLAACTGATATGTPPAPTPQIIYVTPNPTATPLPTIAPEPTFTPDDVKIAGIIKDGAAKIMALADEMSNGGPGDLSLITKLKSLASTQVTLTNVYTASACTADAWASYGQGMTKIESGVTTLISWVAAGAAGAAPMSVIVAGARLVGISVALLNASTCPAP